MDFLEWKYIWISINISLKFVPKGSSNNIPTLVQIMAWRRPGDKPLSEPMLVSLLTHICVTRPQWVTLTTRRSEKSNSRRHFDKSECISFNEKVFIWASIPLKIVPRCPIDNKSAMAQVMAWYTWWWHWSLTHICVNRPQCVKAIMSVAPHLAQWC